MKQKTKDLPDFDTRGRQRRFTEAPIHKVIAYFLDGPVAGRKLLVAAGADYVNIGGIRYSYAGKFKKLPAYARVPKQHIARRVLKTIIERNGKDPRLTFDRKGQRRETT